MKPVRLEFEGINSFSEHTIIDFENLLKGGIFGIFGDTGSGKSTILDCINFALYGKVERSKEKTDIINYNCKSAWVKFTFNIINCGKRKTYYVERTVKKDKAGTHKAVLYEDDVCIADKAQEVEKKIVEIIGVDAEDFRKCIALPQGEFSQFVKSAPRDRLSLIERLFSLSKYGDRLKEKISACERDVEAGYQSVAGKLTVYADITGEAVTALTGKIKSDTEELAETEKKAGALSADYERLKGLYDKKIEYDRVVNSLAALMQRGPEMEELRRDLSRAGYANEAVNCEASVNSVISEIKAKTELISSLKAKAEKRGKEYAVTKAECDKRKYDENIDILKEKLAQYATCRGKPKLLKELSERLIKKRAEYKTEELKYREISLERDRLDAELKKLEELDAKNQANGEMTLKLQGSILRGEYADMLDYFAGLHAKLEEYMDNSALYAFIEREVSEKVSYFKQRIAELKDVSFENTSGRLNALYAWIEEREKATKKLRETIQRKNEADKTCEILAQKMENLKREGIDLAERVHEVESELKAVYGEDCKDYTAANEAAELEKKKLDIERASFDDYLRMIEDELEKGKIEIGREEAALEMLKKSLAEQSLRLENIIKNYGLGDIAECKKIAARFAAYPNAEEELKEYENNKVVLTAKKEELGRHGGIDKITYEEVEACKRLKDELDDRVSAIKKDMAVTEDRLAAVKVKLQEKASLESALAEVEKRRKLVMQLKELTKNNRFLEFIANEYLCEISSAASSTLLNLTDGRYFLTYRENSFWVGDNFNGGNERGVNTLSGGETFLVSLSLALALSQAICARSMKSIEFFFLDEGFGTLDSTLVDTVMTALEKLKSANFIIGVISHVEELKHRIDNRITVYKATELHGSTVKLSC